MNKSELAKLRKLLVDELPTDDVREVEKQIVKIYEDCYFNYELKREAMKCIQSLLSQRWRLMHRSLTWDDNCVAAIEAMNEQMKQALIDMRNKTLATFDWLKPQCGNDQIIDVKGTLRVDDMEIEGWKYGSHMWEYLVEILQTPEIVGLYEDGVTFPVEFSTDDNPEMGNFLSTELEMLYLEDHLDNWNEHLDRKKTANLNIIYGVHNMIDHNSWTLQDLINVKSYNAKIEVEFRNKWNG